jgi:hypothetical protein
MSERESKTVRVRLRVGDADVEVECDVAEVGDVVERVLNAVAGSSIVSDKEKTTRESFTGRGETCKGLILGLWGEGWFGLGRALGDVHAEMGKRGFHYDRTAVAHALVDLVREGVLTREGRPRRYRYVQKRPPQDTGTSKR